MCLFLFQAFLLVGLAFCTEDVQLSAQQLLSRQLTAFHTPAEATHHSLALLHPPFGALAEDLTIDLAIDPAYTKMLLVVEGVREYDLDANSEIRAARGAGPEPGSWFFTVSPLSDKQQPGQWLAGLPAVGYIEFVISAEGIHKLRRFHDVEGPARGSRALVPPQHEQKAAQQNDGQQETAQQKEALQETAQIQGGPQEKLRVCIWSSSVMDGQKHIWLQQTGHMDRDRFSFHWLVDFPEGIEAARSGDGGGGGGAALLQALEVLRAEGADVSVSQSPSLEVTLEDLQQRPGFGEPRNTGNAGSAGNAEAAAEAEAGLAATDLWGGDQIELYRYLHARLLISGGIDTISPPWCRHFYAAVREAFLQYSCAVAVYANGRGFDSSVMLTDTAATLGIPTVAELPNHFLDPAILPSVIVAPSSHTLEQPHLQALLEAQWGREGEEGKDASRGKSPLLAAVVVSPAVDTNLFRPRASSNTSTGDGRYRHPGCPSTDSNGGDTDTESETIAESGDPAAESACIVIGYCARLSPEKSPGLFLQAAFEILQAHPSVRFTIIGDGPLRRSAEELAVRLKMSFAVHFAGWVSSKQLPRMLAGIDVVVNTSLWPETFCISNIEVMSVGIPLVTFAVGGIGEYVHSPREEVQPGGTVESGVGLNGAVSSIGAGDSSTDSSNSTNRTSADTSFSTAFFSLSSNAVLVNHATPTAIASAVNYLITHPDVRRDIGAQARSTVLERFHIQRQMHQYAELYTALRDYAQLKDTGRTFAG
ncbi:hypothetical protein B484DRAFT_443608 [Ochromonadaceae sp. CCMP2298]|nr:hypothetical protein B484DRAFT_443608 [Ochromonadaceae sp. CCMP2298]